MDHEKYWTLMSRYVSGELSLSEADELAEWLDDDPTRADLLKEIQETWDKTRVYPENFRVDTSQAWQTLRSDLSEPVRSFKRKKLSPVRIAIWIFFLLFVILLAVSLWQYHQY